MTHTKKTVLTEQRLGTGYRYEYTAFLDEVLFYLFINHGIQHA